MEKPQAIVLEANVAEKTEARTAFQEVWLSREAELHEGN